jgi:hypothetical protein
MVSAIPARPIPRRTADDPGGHEYLPADRATVAKTPGRMQFRARGGLVLGSRRTLAIARPRFQNARRRVADSSRPGKRPPLGFWGAASLCAVCKGCVATRYHSRSRPSLRSRPAFVAAPPPVPGSVGALLVNRAAARFILRTGGAGPKGCAPTCHDLTPPRQSLHRTKRRRCDTQPQTNFGFEFNAMHHSHLRPNHIQYLFACHAFRRR